MKQYYVYIMTNRSKTLYIGVTNNLQLRIYEHKHYLVAGFTSKYLITRFVYFEETSDVNAALRMTRLSNLGGCVSPSIMNINTISAQVQNIYQSAFTVQPHYPVERSKNYRKMSSNEQTSTT